MNKEFSDYNYLSGVSFNNYHNIFLDVFGNYMNGDSSDKFYLGYLRKDSVWGTNALINVGVQDYDNWLSTYIGGDYGFYDLNSATELSQRVVRIIRTPAVSSDYDISNSDIVNDLTTLNQSTLYLSYIGKNWCMIENLDPLYWKKMSTNYKYYIVPGTYDPEVTDTHKVLKINLKEYAFIPYDKFQVNVCWSDSVDGKTGIINKSPLTYYINSNDEVIISGMDDTETVVDKTTYTWSIKTTQGAVLHNNLSLITPNNTTSMFFESSTYDTYGRDVYKYLLFKQSNELYGTLYLKVTVGPYDYDKFAVWHESLPFESTTYIISDGNPPGLASSYIRSPFAHNSLFDPRGITLINPSEMTFVKEIRSNAEKNLMISLGIDYDTYYFRAKNQVHYGYAVSASVTNSNRIYLTNDFTLNKDDTLNLTGLSPKITYVNYEVGNSYIELDNTISYTFTDVNGQFKIESKPVNLKSSVVLASTDDVEIAKKYGFDKILVNKTVSGDSSPTEDMYRQLAVFYNPYYYDGDWARCTADTYVHDNLYSTDYHEYRLGTVMFLANKIPVTRKYLTQENFELILY